MVQVDNLKGARFGMKLVVQIPCFNEQATLARTITDLPRQLEGVDNVEVLVVDDGSTDDTIAVAQAAGADHIVRHLSNRGLGQAFQTGLQSALALDADIIVNTDADNQYRGEDVFRLVKPILDGAADIVIGDRRPAANPEFPLLKRGLQALGSFVVRLFSRTQVPDAVSGFRAVSREAALQINIVSRFSYTIEMLIQAGCKNLVIESVEVGTNSTPRPSRLIRNIPQFIAQSAATMLRMFAMYRPLTAFAWIGVSCLLVGTTPMVRFLIFWARGDGSGHIQSLVIGGALLAVGSVVLLIGLLAELISFNRQLAEQTLERVRQLELVIAGGKHRPDRLAGRIRTAPQRADPKARDL